MGGLARTRAHAPQPCVSLAQCAGFGPRAALEIANLSASLQDDGGRTRAQLGGLAVATPSTIVLDGQGRVAARISGQVDASTLRGLPKEDTTYTI